MLGTRGARSTATAAAVVLVLAGGWLAVRSVADHRLAAGFVASHPLAVDDLTQGAEVRLPIGTLTLSTGGPLDEVSASTVGESGDGALEAVRGAAIVPLAWSFRPSLSTAEAATYPDTFTMSVESGSGDDVDLGEVEIDLTGSGEGAGPQPARTMVAVVTGDGAGVDLAVTYEGLTQVADLGSGELDSGAAAPLYDGAAVAPATTPDVCDATPGTDLVRLTPARPLDSLNCRVDPVTRTPYLPFLGWADDGEVWNVASVQVTAPEAVRWLGTGARYRVRRGVPTLRLDGAEPVDRTCTAPSGVQTCTATFAAPAGERPRTLRVDAPLTGLRTDHRTGPDPVRFGVHQTFHLIP